MTKRRKPPEAVSGSYTPVPHALLDSKAFLGSSVRAKAMLFDVLRQHNGINNGHLQLSVKWLNSRHWLSADQIQKAKIELLERGLILKTRQGGLGIGPDYYAITWLPISNFKGLDILPRGYHPGAWLMLDAPPVTKHNSHSGLRNNAVPRSGIVRSEPVPSYGTLEGMSLSCIVPQRGNNECCQLHTTGQSSRIVGKKGASGIRTTGVQRT